MELLVLEGTLKKFHSSQIRCKIALVQVSRVWSDSLLVKVQRSINGIQMACSVWFDAIAQHLQNCEERNVVAGLGHNSADNCGGQSHLHSDEIFGSGRHAESSVVSWNPSIDHFLQSSSSRPSGPVVLWSCGPGVLDPRRHRRQSFSLIPSSVKEQLCQGL